MATPVKLPVIKLSTVYGGLTPVKEGGGMQSKSLRLIDKSGKEWVIRSVEKTPERILPPELAGTFAVDWIDDALSSQHPFSALVVPPLAIAANVAHTNPVIGVVESDAILGKYNKIFANLVVLLEEREPFGKTDHTLKMLGELKEDPANSFDAEQFLRARMLDLLLGDWDRHEDQWRWAFSIKGKGKQYFAVPRDRDQVFHLNEGIGPSVASLSWVNPALDHFDGTIPRVKYSLYKTRFIQPYPDSQLSLSDWMRIANEFAKAQNDDVLEAALKLLPPEVYATRRDELFAKLIARRNNIPAAMEKYYRFINKTVDLRFTDKNEQLLIDETEEKGLRIRLNTFGRNSDLKDQSRFNMIYYPDITRTINIYLEDGNDNVVVNNGSSPIIIRIIGDKGIKSYHVERASIPASVYGRKDSVITTGDGKIRKHLSNDLSNTRFIQSNPYNIWMPLANIAINADDGLLLGAGFKYTRREGFRKLPYATTQQLTLSHAFATKAFRIHYSGEWVDAIGQADFTLKALIQAPNNTLNFFGQSNNNALVKFEGYRRYYRTRYNTYQLEPALRWKLNAKTSVSTGLSFQYYQLNKEDNTGRFINSGRGITSYDSLTLDQGKAHMGFKLVFNSDTRDNPVLPGKGYMTNVMMDVNRGVSQFAQSYAQIRSDFTYYQSLNSSHSFVLTNRVGCGVSFGQPAFYQSMFLGGQSGNLLGYLGNRFAGDHMLYNNFQARVKLLNIPGYLLPGQLGITGFYDIGRVWVRGESSDQWHTGNGGGLYFAPATLAVIQVLAGHSKEGWYPYVSLNLRL